jgi:hypothetical protein
MKRFKWAILVVVIIGICAGVVFVPWGGEEDTGEVDLKAGAVQVWMSPASCEASAGDQLGVEIMAETGPGVGISGAEIQLEFDSSALKVTAIGPDPLEPELVGLDPVDENGQSIIYARPGSLLGEDPLVGLKQIDNDAGIVKYALGRVGETSLDPPPGILAGITFEVLETAPAGEYELQLTSVRLADQDFEDIADITVEEAMISVR